MEACACAPVGVATLEDDLLGRLLLDSDGSVFTTPGSGDAVNLVDDLLMFALRSCSKLPRVSFPFAEHCASGNGNGKQTCEAARRAPTVRQKVNSTLGVEADIRLWRSRPVRQVIR